jgi:GDP-4-dehydro-6-deoxy-D-mannose reductase
MRALITGASGFVGKHLTEFLQNSGDEVLGTFNEPLEPELSCQKLRLDVTDHKSCKQVIADFNPDVVYHLAAITFVPEAERDLSIAINVNVGGTANIIEAIKEAKASAKLVFISSSEVYGRTANQKNGAALTENDKLSPGNHYSLSKVLAESVVEHLSERYEIRSLIFRPFNHIGWGQDARFVTSNFARQLARISKGLAEPKLHVGNLESKRDFLDVRDVVRAYRMGAQAEVGGVFNLCSERAVSISEIVQSLIEISGQEITVEQMPERMRPSEIPVFFGSSKKARDVLGWHPKIPLASTLQELYNFCVESESG